MLNTLVHAPSRFKWFLEGRWRSEAEERIDLQELDSKTVKIVPGPPVELEASYLGRKEGIAGDIEHAR